MSTITTTVQPATGSLLTRLLRRHPLIAFFVLAFGLTWPFMIADAFRSHGFLPAGTQVYLMLGYAYGPTWAALIVAGATGGKAGIRGLLRKLLVWRVGAQWYAVAIFGYAALYFMTIKLYTLFGGTLPAWPTLPLGPILSVLVLFLVSGLVNGEELGWRGYALPRLQTSRSALVASLILGGIWAVFHLPLFWTLGSTQASEPPLGFLARVLALAILMTWIFNNTRGSVLLAILCHAAGNTWSQVFPGIDTAHTSVGPIYWLSIGLMCLAAMIVVAVFGPTRLSRKPVAELPVQTDTSTLELTDRTYAEANRPA